MLLLWLGVLTTQVFAVRLVDQNVCSICICKKQLLNCENCNITQLTSINVNLNVTSITFANNKIMYIHKLPKSRIKSLSFASNDIKNIEDAAFKDLSELTALDLSNNLLSFDTFLPNIFRGYYAPDAYEPLLHLKELNVANNQLHALHPDIFEHLPKLEILRLSGNPLKFITQGTIIALASIPLLKELYLSNTQLTNLPENFLHTPKHLEVLELSDNLFSEPPKELENSHCLNWLSLNGNPIQHIRKHLVLPFLKELHISKMPKLNSIEGRSLSKMPLLEEFYCSDNPNLVKIEKTVFSAISSNEEGETWPPLKVIVLNNNSLHYIESHLLSRWDNMKMIDMQNNPWLCDCENQWLVSVLTPIIENIQPKMLDFFKCAEPTEMNEIRISDLSHRGYEMRCLDYYSHMPEKDGKLLIDVCIIGIILTPFLMAIMVYYKRKQRISTRYRKMFFENIENDLNYFQQK